MENNVTTILDGLNSEQKSAVLCMDGPVLIVAGAGSGKTRVLTSRIAYILERGVSAESILALTFTKKAAGEMKERIALMVGERKARRLQMGTFHSVFVRILREYAESLGYPASFTIYDQSDSTGAVKACIRELGLDDKIYKPREVLSRISMAKNNLVTDISYRNSPTIIANDTRAKKPRICDIYSLYVRKCRQSAVMDFDDILLNMNLLLRDNPSACEAVSSRFRYILVDEYQDTNYAQYLILKKLSRSHQNICVVGDDSQSIYAFRGAKIENILNFKKDYPQCRTFRLERNYRSTKVIVEAANSLIAHNAGRIPKTCYSEGGTGEKIHLINAYTEGEEAALVVGAILDRMRRDMAEYRDFAVLYRTNAQSRALEEALRRRNIPYMIYSGNSFFERAEVKDMMAYFKLVVNPHDDESFKRAVNKPSRGIGSTSLDALEAAARSAGVSLFKAAHMDNPALRGAAAARIRSFCDMIRDLSVTVVSEDAHTLSLRIADKSGLYVFYKSDTSIEGLSRMANVDELLNSVAVFVEERTAELASEMEADSDPCAAPVITLDDFLENVSLLSNVDVSGEEDVSNKVSLMTVHSAKGLEYPYVFVTGLEENLFPSGGMLASPADIEEERRLFYVAITRAGKALELSFAGTRMRNGKHESNPPSRFISEIDSKFIDNPVQSVAAEEDFEDPTFRLGRKFTYRYGQSSTVSYSKPSCPARKIPAPEPLRQAPPRATVVKPDIIDPDFVPVQMTLLHKGDRIEHNRFGAGRIMDITGAVPELKARISFDKYGEKTIMLKYAKIRFFNG